MIRHSCKGGNDGDCVIITGMKRAAVVGKQNHLFWGEHVRDALRELGVDAQFFPVNKRPLLVNARRALSKLTMSPRKAQIANDKFAAEVMARQWREFKPDLIFFTGAFFVTHPFYEAAAALSPRPIIAAWDGDSQAREEWAKPFAPFLDVLFSSDKRVIAEHGGNFRRVEYLPFAANPEVHKDAGLTRDNALYFCGAYTQKRGEYLNALAGLPLTVRGKGWERADSQLRRTAKVKAGMLRPDEWIKDCCQHAAVVNIHQAEHGSDSPMNMRVFEAPACGALLLCDKREELPQVFAAGDEVLTYATPQELKEKAQWAIDNPKEAARMALRGHRRALAEHTYRRRLESALAVINNLV